MNICIISHERLGPKKGGVETVCYNLAQELQNSAKHKITHLYGNDKGTETTASIISHPLPSAKSPTAVSEVRSFLSEHHIDIVWNHSPSPASLQLIRQATEGLSVKIVSIFHSTPCCRLAELGDRWKLALHRALYYGEWLSFVALLLKYPLSRLKAIYKTGQFLRAMAEQSDIACTLSDYYIADFHRLSGKKYNNLRAVTNPLISTASLNHVPSSKKNQVLVVARHEWKNKRLDRIIRIWSKVGERFPDWELVMLGDGPAHQDYLKVAKQLKVKNIVFTGTQSPGKYYAESKIICMTSSWEGLPMVLIEAQQLACVPIAYESFSALPDIIENGETGFRIPPFDEQHFIEKLTYLMTHEEERERMAHNCVQHSKKFAVSNIADRWVSIFTELLSHP